MPAFDPFGPRRIGAFDVGGVVVSAAHRRIAIPQGGDHALQRIQHRTLVPVGGRMRTQRRERRGIQIVEPGTAVEQQGLAEHPPHPALAQAVAVAPPVEHLAGPLQRLLHRGFTKDQAGQVKPIECAQAVEVGEPAEQVGQSHDVRPHRRLGRRRLRGDEPAGTGPAQPRPLPRRPAPPGPAGVRAVLQDRARRVRARASVTHVLAVMQHGEGLIERFDQAGQRIPL